MGFENFMAASRKRNLRPFSLLPSSSDISWIEDNLSTAAAPTRETPSGTINGVNNVFTLSEAPVSADLAMITVNGLIQVRGTSYSLTSTTITFETGYTPQTGDIIEAWIWS